jgi:hypothetical protein
MHEPLTVSGNVFHPFASDIDFDVVVIKVYTMIIKKIVELKNVLQTK